MFLLRSKSRLQIGEMDVGCYGDLKMYPHSDQFGNYDMTFSFIALNHNASLLGTLGAIQ